MAKTLRTSGDYTVKTGTGAGGSNTVFLDSKTTRVLGDFVVDGLRTELNSTSLQIEDQFLVVNKNNSTIDTEDSGIFFNRGTLDHALLFWDASVDKFKLITTTHDDSVVAVTNITLAKLEVAEPGSASDVATKNYVDTTASGATLTGSTNNTITTVTGANAIQGEANATFDGGTLAITGNITATTNIENDAIRITDHTILGLRSNDNIVINPAGTGSVVINDILTWSAAASDPTADAVTKIYNKTAGGGGTGVFFRNSNIGSGAVGELISKSKATALAIALG